MSLEFEKACELDLEGIVAKHQHAPYDTEKSTWFKIRNPTYSQMVGREELFERERHREPVPVAHLRSGICSSKRNLTKPAHRATISRI